MSSVVIAGDVSGTVTLQAPSAAGSTVLSLPSTTGTILTTTSGNAVSATTATTATNLSGGSAGTVPYQSASGATAMLAAGTSGQVLTSAGASAPTWTTPATGAMTLISTQTASGATVSFTGLSGYDRYMVIFSGINQGTNAGSLRFVFGTGATPTYVTSGYYSYSIYLSTAGTPTQGLDNNAAYGYVNSGTAGGRTTVGTSGILYFQNFTSGADTSFQAQSFQQTAVTTWSYDSVGGALVNNSTAKTAIQFSNNSGVNFSGGTLSLYGIS